MCACFHPPDAQRVPALTLLPQMRARLQQLQASLKGREAEVARLTKLLDHAKVGIERPPSKTFYDGR